MSTGPVDLSSGSVIVVLLAKIGAIASFLNKCHQKGTLKILAISERQPQILCFFVLDKDTRLWGLVAFSNIPLEAKQALSGCLCDLVIIN